MDTTLELTNSALMACANITDYVNLQKSAFGSFLLNNVFNTEASAPAATKANFIKGTTGVNIKTGNYLGNLESVVFSLSSTKPPKSITAEVSIPSPVADARAMLLFSLQAQNASVPSVNTTKTMLQIRDFDTSKVNIFALGVTDPAINNTSVIESFTGAMPVRKYTVPIPNYFFNCPAGTKFYLWCQCCRQYYSGATYNIMLNSLKIVI